MAESPDHADGEKVEPINNNASELVCHPGDGGGRRCRFGRRFARGRFAQELADGSVA